MNKIEKLSITVQSLNDEASEKIKQNIREIVNDLIIHDFNQLVQFLYRVDVSEKKLKQLLHDFPQTDAAALITDLLIERQLEKARSRSSSKNDQQISDEEKW